MGQASSQVRAQGPYMSNSRRFAIREIEVYPNAGEEPGLPTDLDPNANSSPFLTIETDPQTLQISVRRKDSRPLEFVQDPDTLEMLLRLPYCSSITFKFKLQLLVTPNNGFSNVTFVTGDSRKQLDSFIDMELLENPNIQNEENVVLLGDFAASGDAPDIRTTQFLWTWLPSLTPSVPGGSPVHFAFCEYDKRDHSLAPLAGAECWIAERPEDVWPSIPRLASPPPAIGDVWGLNEPFSPETSAILSPLKELTLSNIPPMPTSAANPGAFSSPPSNQPQPSSSSTASNGPLSSNGAYRPGTQTAGLAGLPGSVLIPVVQPQSQSLAQAQSVPSQPQTPVQQHVTHQAPTPGAVPMPAPIQPHSQPSNPATPGQSHSHSQTQPLVQASRDDVKHPAQRPDSIRSIQPEDGPVFRSTIASMEKRSAVLKAQVKLLLKRAILLHERLKDVSDAEKWFGLAVASASKSDVTAFQTVAPFYSTPDFSLGSLRNYTATFMNDFAQHVIRPLRDIYENEIKTFEIRKRDFDFESSQYYSWMSRYLSTKKEKRDKTMENDAKYSDKRRTFELNRFDYFSYLIDLHGGRKIQDLTLQLALFAQRLTDMSVELGSDFYNRSKPFVDETISDLRDASKDWSRHRTEREVNRRALERSIVEFDPAAPRSLPRAAHPAAAGSNATGASATTSNLSTINTSLSSDAQSSSMSSPADELPSISEASSPDTLEHKEGLLWALSRPGGIQETQNLQKQGLKWHKYWVVQDGGKLCEYTNWKQGAALHNEPIDLKVAGVREARAADRRFCFEVVTPHYKRVYQATSDEDMNSWIKSIGKGISTSLGMLMAPGGPLTMGSSDIVVTKQRETNNKFEKIGRKLSLKTDRPKNSGVSGLASPGVVSASSISGGQLFGSQPGKAGHPRSERVSQGPGAATISEEPQRKASGSGSQSSGGGATSPLAGSVPNSATSPVSASRLGDASLLAKIQSLPGNRVCGDCRSQENVEWVSINLMMVLCIDCSGAHRSLGTHISKVRSLILDTVSFTGDLVSGLLSVSNQQMNEIWEARLANRQTVSDKNRLRYITEKYVEKLYINELQKPNTALRKAVAEQSVFAACEALAARANPNSTSDDGEPMLVAALRAAGDAHEFAVAEVLILNGAALPKALPEDLTSEARRFLHNRFRR